MPLRQNSYYRKILLGLLSFCVIPALVAFILTYHVYSRNIIDKYASHEVERLKRVALSNSQIFHEMTKTFQDIPTSLNFIYFSRNTFSEDITRFYSFCEMIMTRLLNSRYLHSATLYSQKFNYIWSMANTGAEEVFSRETDHLAQYSTKEYYNRFFYREDPVSGKGIISYIFPSFQNGVRGELLFIINIYADVLVEDTAKLSDSYAKDVYLKIDKRILHLDGDNKLDNFSFPAAEKEDGWAVDNRQQNKRILTTARGEISSMTYCSLIRMRDYISDFRSFFLLAFILFCLFLLIALFLAFYYTRYLYAPMNNLIQSLSPPEGQNRVDEFQLIINKYMGIVENNRNLKEVIDANELIMRDRFLENLFKGHYESRESIECGLKQFKITLSDKCLVINCYIENRQEIIKKDWPHWLQIKSRLQNMAEETLSEYDSGSGLTCEFSGEEIIIILSFNTENKMEIALMVESFLADFMERCHPVIEEKIHLGVGLLTEKKSDWEDSYRQSTMALRLGLLPGDQRIHHYQQSRQINKKNRSGGKILNQFIGLIKSTGQTDLNAFLNKIMSEMGKEASPRSSYSYAIKIISTTAEYIESQFGISPESYLVESPYLKITQCQTMGEIRAELKGFLENSLTLLREKKLAAGVSGKKVRIAEEYINKNYNDMSLNLAKISEKTGLNPSYMSRLFSQERGQSFQDYLTELRLREAKKQIVSTDLPLYKISEQVGFGSVLSFNRNFKKQEGCTPKEYRENFN